MNFTQMDQGVSVATIHFYYRKPLPDHEKVAIIRLGRHPDASGQLKGADGGKDRKSNKKRIFYA